MKGRATVEARVVWMPITAVTCFLPASCQWKDAAGSAPVQHIDPLNRLSACAKDCVCSLVQCVHGNPPRLLLNCGSDSELCQLGRPSWSTAHTACSQRPARMLKGHETQHDASGSKGLPCRLRGAAG